MAETTAGPRLWGLDLTRGFLILLMTLGHAIFFFHTGYQPFLRGVNGLADHLCFTGLLLLAGMTAYWAYLHLKHPHRSMVRRLSQRLWFYLLGYYLIALIGSTWLYGWSWSVLVNILTFRSFIPFTEFIPVFIIFGLLKITLKNQLESLS